MFESIFKKKKYITLLTEDWKVLKKLEIIELPRERDFIYNDETYYKITHFIHLFNDKQTYFAVVKKITDYPFINGVEIEL